VCRARVWLDRHLEYLWLHQPQIRYGEFAIFPRWKGCFGEKSALRSLVKDVRGITRLLVVV
jgi:hypothetical protein